MKRFLGFFPSTIFIAAFLFTFAVRLDTNIDNMQFQATDSLRLVNQSVQIGGEYIAFLSLYANDYYNKKVTTTSEWYPLLRLNGDRYSMDVDEKSFPVNKIGNLTGQGPLPASGPLHEELLLALSLNQYFEEIVNALPDTAWVYYTSAQNFINLYPWVPSSEFSYTDELFRKEYYYLGLPNKNPQRQRYWTPVYRDAAGKGLMVTVSAPVYDKNTFKGVISLDFTLKTLSTYLPAKYTCFIVNDHQQVLAATFAKEKLAKNIVTLDDLSPELSPILLQNIRTAKRNSIQLISGNFVYVVKVDNAPWTIYFIKSIWEMLWSSFLFSLPLLIIGLLLNLSYREIELNKHKEKELQKLLAELKESQKISEKASLTDFLTGIANRRSIYEEMRKAFLPVTGSAPRASILIGDIDRFKLINDKFGHDIGDMVLVTIANALQDCLRSSDFLGRWGGEEFLIFLPGANYIEAYNIAERMRDHIEKLPLSKASDSTDLHCTISFGVAEYNPKMGLDESIKMADIALLAAKNAGRNAVVCYNEISNNKPLN